MHGNSGNNGSKEAIVKLKQECNKRLVEHIKTYQTAIISGKKKHYVGWTGIKGEEPDIKDMEGKKVTNQ